MKISTNTGQNLFIKTSFSLKQKRAVTNTTLTFIFHCRTAMKYVKKAMDDIKHRPEDSDERVSILGQVLLRGLSYPATVAMTIDFLMAGIDTVNLQIQSLHSLK